MYGFLVFHPIRLQYQIACQDTFKKTVEYPLQFGATAAQHLLDVHKKDKSLKPMFSSSLLLQLSFSFVIASLSKYYSDTIPNWQ